MSRLKRENSGSKSVFFLDGRILEGVTGLGGTLRIGRSRKYEFDELSKSIMALRLNEIHPSVRRINIMLSGEDSEKINGMFKLVNLYIEFRNEKATLSLRFAPLLYEWNKPWTLLDFGSVLGDCASENEHVALLKNNPAFAPNEYYPFFYLKGETEDRPISDLRDYVLEQVKCVFSAAEKRSAQKIQTDSIIEYFSFPPEMAAPCKQYLSYFTQFLRDLGMSADTEIKDEIDKILFSVKPKDGKEALSAVHEALRVYLSMPMMPPGGFTAMPGQDPAMMQLIANVHHLQSQLLLAQAENSSLRAAVEYKDATLRFLEKANGPSPMNNTTQLAERTIIDVAYLDSTDDGTQIPSRNLPAILDRDVDRAEAILGGVIKLGVVRPFGENSGIEIDLAKLSRILKRRRV